MVEIGEAYQDLMTGETTEANEVRGRIGFGYGQGQHTFVTSRVMVEFVHTPERFVSWTIRFPVEPPAFEGIMPLLGSLGTSEGEVLNLPPDEHMEVTLSAKPGVLERLSPELVKLDKLSAMFQAGEKALLNLDNYENGSIVIAEGQGEESPA